MIYIWIVTDMTTGLIEGFSNHISAFNAVKKSIEVLYNKDEAEEKLAKLRGSYNTSSKDFGIRDEFWVRRIEFHD